MNKASISKGEVPLPIEDAKKLEKLLYEVSNERYLNDQNRRKAQKHAVLLTEMLRAPASGRISLPWQVFLATLQCLAFALRHSMKRGLDKLMGDE
ncbi:MAG: hypothetical protein Q6354_06240 [Candidatus Brocadiales bacterium]|nr:hypothetical protein [Candidatus Brocadiales bacterium]